MVVGPASGVDSSSLACLTWHLLQDCEPLWLDDGRGSRFRFAGAQSIASGAVSAADAFAPPDAAGTGASQCFLLFSACADALCPGLWAF